MENKYKLGGFILGAGAGVAGTLLYQKYGNSSEVKKVKKKIKKYSYQVKPIRKYKKPVRKSGRKKYGEGGDIDWYDFDKKMALINLGQIDEYSIKLDALVAEDTQLEDWVKMKLTRVEQNVADVKKSLEGWEKYSEGGRIFKKQLLHINKYAKDLIAMIQGGSKLMSWQENKLAISADYIDNIYHHLDYEMGNRAYKRFESGGAIGLSKNEKSIIDDRLDYYYENNEYTKDIDVLVDFVIEGGEIDASKYNDIKKYIKSNFESGGGVNYTLDYFKMKQEDLDDEGNTVVSYDESDDSWLWEDYKTSVVRRGFESEYDAYDNLVGYLEGQYIYFESGGDIQWDDASWSEQEAFSPYMNRYEYENLNWASKTFSKSSEILVRENLQDGEICICKLKKILGHEPNYPTQVVGSLKLTKCYLRNYYRV